MDFDYDALKAAHRTAALITNPVGKPMNVSLDTFVCARGYAVHNRATEILGAISRGYIPGSADRDGPATNPISGAAPSYKIIALPWFTTNTLYWFMLDSSMKGSRYGLQYKELIKWLLSIVRLIEKLREFGGHLIETIPSQVRLWRKGVETMYGVSR